MYWGCANSGVWPRLQIGQDGCQDYYQYGWGGKPATWCFCDYSHCNSNVTYIANKYGSNTIRAKNKTGKQKSLVHRKNRGGRLLGMHILNDIGTNTVTKTTYQQPEAREVPKDVHITKMTAMNTKAGG